MPIVTKYPGVYVQEIPSGVRTIIGVSTSTTAFIGYFKKGPMGTGGNDAVRCLNFADFERAFGGLDEDSEASFAIYQFFLNGGTEAWVIRTASGDPTAARLDAKSPGTTGAVVLKMAAANPGTWGNALRVVIDYQANRTGEFNLIVNRVDPTKEPADLIESETFRNLVMVKGSANYVADKINENSRLLRVEVSGDGPDRPAPTGTLSGDLTPVFPNGNLTLTKDAKLTVLIKEVNNVDGFTGTITVPKGTYTMNAMAKAIGAGLRGLPNKTMQSVATSIVRGKYMEIIALGAPNPTVLLTFSGDLAKTLLLEDATAIAVNVQQYTMGSAFSLGAQVGGGTDGDGNTFAGTNGTQPDADAIIGSPDTRTGMYALDEVDVFNLMSIPILRIKTPAEYTIIVDNALNYCARRFAFLIPDIPVDTNSIEKMESWMNENASLRSKNSAIYFPNTLIPDPLMEYRPRSVAASGTMAGLYSATDANRGVWKAPAGTEAGLKGLAALEYNMTDDENGVLNPIGVNCLRNFTNYGNISWGARTTEGSDVLASEWKYIPVRRTALYIELSLKRALKWVVFEPNDEPLWGQIRMNVGSFLHSMFTKGAFQGQSPKESYFVNCDSSTTTQNDIDKGIVNILVGFAPLKPAEFVIISLQQIAGQVET